MEIEIGKIYKHKRLDRVICVYANDKGYIYYYRLDEPEYINCLFYKKVITDYEPYDANTD